MRNHDRQSSVPRSPAARRRAERQPVWWRGAVIYEVYLRSFSDSDGDGTGDLRGTIARLDYLADLGIDALWISPFFQSPMKDFGYDVSDYRQVDPLFGTLDDFDRLVEQAHRRGIRIMIDQVLSHTSDEHAWFKESRQSCGNDKADWYVWADPKPDGTPPNNWLAMFGGSAWQWEPRRQQYYLHNFLVGQPDLNYHCPDVAAQMLDEVEFWLKRGVDGLRLDAINFCFHDPLLRDNPPKPAEHRKGRGFATDNPYAWQYHVYDNTRPENLAFLEALRRLANRYPAAVTLGEVSSEDSLTTTAEYTGGNDRLHMAYTFELLGDRFSTEHVRSVIEGFRNQSADAWPCWALGNHDTARVVSRWRGAGPADAWARLFNAFLFSLRGSACSYQGEELGLEEAELPREALRDPYGIAFWPAFKGRDGCRTPMPWTPDGPACGFSTVNPWLPIPATHGASAVSRQLADRDSVLNAYRRFLHWRREHPVFRDGDMRFVDAPPGQLCFLREHEGESLLACFNFSRKPGIVTLRGLGGIEALDGHGFDACALTGDRLEIPPLGAFFAYVNE